MHTGVMYFPAEELRTLPDRRTDLMAMGLDRALQRFEAAVAGLYDK